MEYYVHLADETLEKLEGVIAGVDIESVEFTENGEYTAPSGTAYGSVSVNVEGGGGTSDFSTAEVTVVSVGQVHLEMPTLLIVPEVNLEGTFIEPYGDSPYTVILYKGKAYVNLDNPESISGDIEYDEDTHLYVITGDCTINFGDIM